MEKMHPKILTRKPNFLTHGIKIVVELGKLVDVVPDFPVRGMENVGAVGVDVDAVFLLAVNVAADVAALVEDEAGFALLFGFVGEHGAEEAGADDEVVIVHVHCSLSLLYCCAALRQT